MLFVVAVAVFVANVATVVVVVVVAASLHFFAIDIVVAVNDNLSAALTLMIAFQ